MTEVVIVKGIDPVDVTFKALKMIKANKFLDRSKQVLIKPNYINAKHPSTGITTDGRVIEGTIKYLKQYCVNDIIIGEGSGFSDTFKAFKVAGVDSIAKKWGVQMIDLNKDKFVEINVIDSISLKKVKIAKTALESVIISVPKLKIHSLTRVTLSLKNMLGVMVPKGSMHRGNLSKNIADLCSIVKPSIAVIDGIIAGEVHETRGYPVEMNIMIAGTDPVAVDSVGAYVMGISPGSVKHLLYANQKGLGVYDLNSIKLIGEPIQSVRKKFKESFTSKMKQAREKVTDILPNKNSTKTYRLRLM